VLAEDDILLWVEFESIINKITNELSKKETPLNFWDMPFNKRDELIQEEVEARLEKKTITTDLDLSYIDDGVSGDEIETHVDVEADAKAKLKGTVGGVQGIISINQAVADGSMTEKSAESLLVEIYGFDQKTAGVLIEKTRKTGQEPS
jgi:hypothetical protein